MLLAMGCVITQVEAQTPDIKTAQIGKANLLEYCANVNTGSYPNYYGYPLPLIDNFGTALYILPLPVVGKSGQTDKVTSPDCRLPDLVSITERPRFDGEVRTKDQFNNRYNGFTQRLPWTETPINPEVANDLSPYGSTKEFKHHLNDSPKLIKMSRFSPLPKTIIGYGVPYSYLSDTIKSGYFLGRALDAPELLSLMDGVITEVKETSQVDVYRVTITHHPLIKSYYYGFLNKEIKVGQEYPKGSLMVSGKYPILAISISGIVVDPDLSGLNP